MKITMKVPSHPRNGTTSHRYSVANLAGFLAKISGCELCSEKNCCFAVGKIFLAVFKSYISVFPGKEEILKRQRFVFKNIF